MTKAAQRAIRDNPTVQKLYLQFIEGGRQRDMAIAELYLLPPHFATHVALMLAHGQHPMKSDLLCILVNHLTDRFVDDRDGRLGDLESPF